LTAFFTLNDNDLKAIGIKQEADRKKMLEFINDFSTPEKPKRIPFKNLLFRN